jgi:four helix bundle protein
MDKQEMLNRFLNVGVRSLRITNALPKNVLAKHVALQFFRAATSAGANYCEACGAESSQDFAHKLQIVIKELRETDFWVRLIALSGMIREGRLRNFREEVSALTAIRVAAVKTLKSRKGGR